jgi:hypothetical protein
MTDKQPGLASIARAFATYSLVPYLGILFCPGAVVAGSLGVIQSYRFPTDSNASARGACYISAIVGALVLIIQLLLWWILYKVPEWAKGF